MFRQALPGAMKMPQGAKDRETILGLVEASKRQEAQIRALTERVSELESKLGGQAPDDFTAMDREALKAHLTAKGVEFARNASDEKLRELCRAQKPSE
jgi:hypothetical protein